MSDERDESLGDEVNRRSFVGAASGAAMASGLLAGYGTFAVMAARFLYPIETDDVGWQYLSQASELPQGKAREYVAPSGAKIVVARQGEGTSAEDFIALSSVCPHLGCQVHWEALNERFFCPCHNGVFDPQGRATEGPPAKANQPLLRYMLKIENDLLFILAPLRAVV